MTMPFLEEPQCKYVKQKDVDAKNKLGQVQELLRKAREIERLLRTRRINAG